MFHYLGILLQPEVIEMGTSLPGLIDFCQAWGSPRTTLHMDGGLDHFFPNSIPLDLAKDDFTII